jgi:hypothetical protein
MFWRENTSGTQLLEVITGQGQVLREQFECDARRLSITDFDVEVAVGHWCWFFLNFDF